jgi:hypothetical protein
MDGRDNIIKMENYIISNAFIKKEAVDYERLVIIITDF